DHLGQLDAQGVAPIDLLVVNLYPFEETVAKGADFAEAIEQIDIGGPALIRGSAKNHDGVAVLTDPADYPALLEALETHDGATPRALRRKLAAKAYARTAAYDAAIATWLQGPPADDAGPFHRRLSIDLSLDFEPRYGENPHQPAAVYSQLGGRGVLGGFEQLQGKQLSFNNLLDADAARRMVAQYDEPAVVIVKHNNPCGIGRGDHLLEAYERALACDPTSAFGSVIAVNRTADLPVAQAMSKLFVEVLLAPEIAEDAKAKLAAKKRLRVLRCPVMDPASAEVELRAVDGGFLAQAADVGPDDVDAWQVVTERPPSADERRALEMAWKVCRGVKSNAIVLATGDQSVGIGAGQMSRVDSCHLAVHKAQLPIDGAAAASDAFFPFRDGLDTLAEAGVTAVVQPGGSKRDDEVIAAANEHGIAMVLTGRRHFRH
ncbi:MAG: bifunctional phosphoribosylaminoimidazolecarboxamide formyltransferase/IMP cyclohydrolase, partial [Acidobacteriota bacterium]